MEESLLELLRPYIATPNASPTAVTSDAKTTKYLARLSSLHLEALTISEPESLKQTAHSNQLSLQGLSARSHAPIVSSTSHLAHLTSTLPSLGEAAQALRDDVPQLDREAVNFAEKYSRISANEVLDRRKTALLMARNVERLTDILDLPTLLSSTIASSTSQGPSYANSNASALDLHSHIKRLHLLHKESAIIGSIFNQTEEAMQEMTSNLITGLKSQTIKLAAGLRNIGWLKRIAPELDGSGQNKEGSLGALFLVCRLATLMSMLSALEPLRDLADQETALRLNDEKSGKLKNAKDSWSHGQQTERYLKRYIEIFREQSFSIISMYRSIFPATPDEPSNDHAALGIHAAKTSLKHNNADGTLKDDLLNPIPPALSTFPLHLISLISTTLQQYLPNVRDKSSRESLLTQVLYCAGSLGRLGGDFSMLLASLSSSIGSESHDEDEEDIEWINVMKKHRVLASRLEKMASGGSKTND